MTKTIKKTLALVLSVLMIMSVVPMGMVFATDIEFTYVLDGDGNAIIIDYSPKTATEVVIPDEIDGYTVVQVGRETPEEDLPFNNNKNIISVVYPDTVTFVVSGSFYGCTNLEEIVLGTGIAKIESNAFGGCAKLNTIKYKGSQEDWLEISITPYGNGAVIFSEYTKGFFVFNYCDNHELIKIDAKDATCECDGNLAYWSCLSCGRLFEDEDGTIETELEKVTVEGGHKWSDTYIDGEDGNHYYICTVENCGAKDEASRQGHQWDEGAITIESTCTEPGEEKFVCTVCNAEKFITIEHKGHMEETNHVQQPTCTETGRTGGKWCTVCQKYTEDPTEIEALGHDWVKGENHIDATCTQEGYDDLSCSRCDATQIGVSQPLGHDYPENWIESTSASCNSQGIKIRFCQRDNCNVFETDFIPATNHEGTEKRTEITEVQVGTCAAESIYLEVIYCIACGEKVSETEKTGTKDFENHTGETYTESENGFDGTCISPKKWDEVTYCSGCDKELDREQVTGDVNKEAHVGILKKKIENEKAGNCKARAAWDEVIYCSACGEEDSRVSVVGDYNNEKHLGIKKTRIENEVAGTCKDVASWDKVIYCSGCENVIEVIAMTGEKDAHNHTNLIKTDAVEATCEDDGNIAYWTCEGCAKLYEDEDATLEITAEDTVIEAIDHKWSAWIFADEDGHKSVCMNDETHVRYGECFDSEDEKDCYCDLCRVVLEHNFAEANCTEPETCLVCGATDGDIDPENHVGETDTVIEDIVEGTCTTESTWNVVTYCTGCDEAISVAPKTGEKNPENHDWSDIIAPNNGADKVHYIECQRQGCNAKKDIVHNEGTVRVSKEPTCTEQGQQYYYCSYCKSYIYETIEATGHADSNKDNKCDTCGVLIEEPKPEDTEPENPTPENPQPEDPSADCDCNCHKNGIMGFLFDFILFFQRLFGANRTCACGVTHY